MKILIADDHELFLQGLEFILKKEYPDATIIAAKDYVGIFDVLDNGEVFDLIITDLAMPGANWLTAIKKIHQQAPDTPIVIISAVFDREILQKTFDIGVSGYISKSFPNGLIVSAINLVMAGGMYIPPDVLQMSINTSSQRVREIVRDLDEANTDSSEKVLTPRQMDVLKCLEKGLSNKQIAYKLGLSEGTVKIHITLLMRALDVTNRLAAVRAAVDRGLL
ncbi:MAG: response regulator transcription factor [Alphaproteobacteria bacterium]|nr:response regulator transcription factor [Alphaproteobacteria bacterium]